MAVVDVSSMPDGFDDKYVVVSIPRDDRTVVASTEFVVGIAGEFL
jgi:hypothetical protein